VAEVIAHQPLDALPRLRAGIPEHLRRPLLQIVAEHVVIAAGFEVKDRTHAQQEILRVFEASRVRRPPAEQQRVGQHRDRPRRGQIAEPTRRLFHIRLELVQRVVELRVPLDDELHERLDDVSVGRCLMKREPEPVEQGTRTRHQPRVEQRQQELGVVGLQIGKLVDLANLVSDDDAEIPERMKKAAEEALLGGPIRLPNSTRRSMSECRHRCRRPYPPRAMIATGAEAAPASMCSCRSSASTRSEWRSTAPRPPVPREISLRSSSRAASSADRSVEPALR
jgi:hypothetical protein